ncbi:MAG TPA: ABC transporter ATP-binding protein [Pseudogracilibacillus sp.]|nr:ABC transporter ATP-binding protein [Pseudogracilibacillus sp.]
MEYVLKAEGVEKVYGKAANQYPALQDVSFTIEHGEFVGVMGPSGAGKSSLLNVLATIDSPTRGNIFIESDNIVQMKEPYLSDFRRDHLGFIFQDYNLLDSLTVKENIILPLAIKKEDPRLIEERVVEMTELFKISHLLSKYPHQLSGGEKQRVAASRAMITNPKLLFADEPTGALDSRSATDLLHQLESLNTNHLTTVLMVTHDAFAASFCRRILFISDGRLLRELSRGNKSREEFFQIIMNQLASMGGGNRVHG